MTAGIRPTKEEGMSMLLSMVTNMFSTMDSNDLASLKEVFGQPGESGIEQSRMPWSIPIT